MASGIVFLFGGLKNAEHGVLHAAILLKDIRGV